MSKHSSPDDSIFPQFWEIQASSTPQGSSSPSARRSPDTPRVADSSHHHAVLSATSNAYQEQLLPPATIPPFNHFAHSITPWQMHHHYMQSFHQAPSGMATMYSDHNSPGHRGHGCTPTHEIVSQMTWSTLEDQSHPPSLARAERHSQNAAYRTPNVVSVTSNVGVVYLPPEASRKVAVKLANDSRVCRTCNREFGRAHERKRHEKYVHSDAKDWKCDSCEKRYKRKDDCDRHARSCTARPAATAAIQ